MSDREYRKPTVQDAVERMLASIAHEQRRFERLNDPFDRIERQGSVSARRVA
jgi:hypothetical protein